MYYAPHFLQVKKFSQTRDSLNRTVSVYGEWEDVGPCRCDDNSTQIVDHDTGRAFIPRYHVVADNTKMISSGDRIRCLNKDGSVRGEGEVKNPRSLNYLNYFDCYAE